MKITIYKLISFMILFLIGWNVGEYFYPMDINKDDPIVTEAKECP